MAIGYIHGAGGGGVTSSDVTAARAQVLAGYETVTTDSDDGVVEGTMENNGSVTRSLGFNGAYTIPKGYHDGTGKVTQNIAVTAQKSQVLQGYTAVTSDSGTTSAEGTMTNRGSVNQSLDINGTYTIPKGYHDGTGKVTQNVTTKAAATYYATTANQTISSGQYLSGTQTISQLTQSGLSASNIVSGKTVTINNGNANVWNVTGTALEHAHTSGTVVSGSSYQDSSGYTYPVVIDLPFIPVTGYVITYVNQNRDITIVDPNTGGGKSRRIVNFNQPKLHGLNSTGYAEGDYNYTCTKAHVVLPVSYGDTTYNYFFSGYKA